MAEILAAGQHAAGGIPWPRLSPETRRRKIQACVPYVRAVDPGKTVAENVGFLLDVARASDPHAQADACALAALAWTVLCLHGTPRI